MNDSASHQRRRSMSGQSVSAPLVSIKAAGSSQADTELSRFERMLAEISAGFINLPASQVDAAIDHALQGISRILDVDRSTLLRFDRTSGMPRVTHSGSVDSVPSVSRSAQVSLRFPWSVAQMRNGAYVSFTAPDELPEAAAIDKASWQRIGIRSHLSMPMVVAGRLEGAIALGCMRRHRQWPGELLARVRMFTDVLGNALAHKRAQEELDTALRFEQLVTRILASLLTAKRAELDNVIETGLHDVAQVLGAQRATLWQRTPEMREFRETHRWLAADMPAPPDITGSARLPWITGQLLSGTAVSCASIEDLPCAAAMDLPAFKALGMQSLVIVPLEVAGTIVGALSFASEREERDWAVSLIPRVQLLGEVLASMLARERAEQRESEAHATAAHAARLGTMGVVAASLAHELTQPLAAIMLNAETAARILEAPNPDRAELQETLAEILSDDRRAGELIRQLRRFLRRNELERSEISIREALDETVGFARNEAKHKGVSLTFEADDRLADVLANRAQIQQVVLNLLLNGFDAVSDRPAHARRVALAASRSASGVVIKVTDNGAGMDEAILARIFTPFFTTKSGGMGLGLSISRSILEAHGGSLSVRSEPGEGSTFRIELPACSPGVAAGMPA